MTTIDDVRSMNEKAKYFALVIITALAVSAITSYVTTLSLQNAQNTQQPEPSQQPSQNTTKISINVTGIEFTGDSSGNNFVQVSMDMALNNVTVVYNYTCLNGTVFTDTINYGRCDPAWVAGNVIEPGGVTPDLTLRIPGYIVHASSSTKTEERIDEYGRTYEVTVWDVYPQVEVLEAYGYT
jgi:hypothetical protein